MIDSFLIPPIHETRGETRQQIQSTIRLSQQQPSGIGGLLATVESSGQLSGKMSFELEALLATLCHQKGRLSLVHSESSQTLNATSDGLFWSS
jgi:hypothetical protein